MMKMMMVMMLMDVSPVSPVSPVSSVSLAHLWVLFGVIYQEYVLDFPCSGNTSIWRAKRQTADDRFRQDLNYLFDHSEDNLFRM